MGLFSSIFILLQTNRLRICPSFLLVFLFSKALTQTNNTYSIYSKGQLLLEQGKYDLALISTKEQFKRKSLPRDLNIIASCFYHKFRFDSAQHYFNMALSRSENQHISEEEKLKSYIGKCKIAIRLVKPQDVANLLPFIKEIINKNSLVQYLPYSDYFDAYTSMYSDEKKSDRMFIKAIKYLPTKNPDIIDFYIRYIDFLIEKRNNSQAKIYLDRAFSLVEEFKRYEDSYWDLLLEKGFYWHRVGEYQKSINIYEKELFPLLKKQKSDWAKYTLAEYYRMCSWPLKNIRNSSKSLSFNKKYLELIVDFHKDDFIRYFETYFFMANIYNDLGLNDLSNEYTKKAIEISLKIGHHSGTLRGLFNAGLYEFRLNNFDKALSNFNKVIDYPLTPLRTRQYSTLSKKERIKIYIKKREFERATIDALDFKKEYISLFPKNDAALIHANNAYLQVLLLLDDTKNIKYIVEELMQLRNFEIYLNDAVLMEFCNNFTSYLIKKNYLDSANNLLDKILAHKENHILSNHLKVNNRKSSQIINTLSLKGEVFRAKYSLNKNRNYLDSTYYYFFKCIEFTKIINEKYRSINDQILFQKKKESVFHKIIDISFEIYNESSDVSYLNRNFSFIEQAKSNALLKSLNRSNATRQTSIPDTLLLKINSLKQQSTYLKAEIAKLESKANLTTQDSTKLLDYRFTLTNNKVAFQETMQHLEENYPNYYEQTYRQKSATVADVQANLKEGEALIEYYVGKEQTYAFTIAKDTATFNTLPHVSASELSQYNHTMQPEYFGIEIDSAHSKFLAQSYSLYEKLLAKPLSNLAGKDIQKLYIIPDRELNFLPFESLLTKELPATNIEAYGDLPYLLKDYIISYGYSASILFRETLEKTREKDSQLLAIAPSYGALLNDTTAMRNLGKFRDSFTELSYNKNEVDGIKEYFDGTVYKHQEATKAAFMEQLANHDIIHLAMHAFVDTEEPNYSKLIFTPKGDTLTDSYLHNFELYNMSIPARMAVLSACNTGNGELAGGEGVMSLARAFTYAGTESVVMSHWRVDDKAGSLIMKDFYKFLADGLGKDEALRKAKLAYISSEEVYHLKQHPFFWSNFVVLGDVSPLVEANKNRPLYLYALGFLLALASLFFVRRRFLIRNE